MSVPCPEGALARMSRLFMEFSGLRTLTSDKEAVRHRWLCASEEDVHTMKISIVIKQRGGGGRWEASFFTNPH